MSEPKSVVIVGLVSLADVYCAKTGRSRSSVAKAIFGRGGQIDDLAAGVRDLTTRMAEVALVWFSDQWPVDLDWPADIDRPQPERAVSGNPDNLDAGDPSGVLAGSASSQAGTGPFYHKIPDAKNLEAAE